MSIEISFEEAEKDAQEMFDLALEVNRLARELAEARKTLQFVERWVNHHGTKECMTPAEVLSTIQHHPDISSITDSYVDGKRPNTRNPWAEISEARAEIDRLKAGAVPTWTEMTFALDEYLKRKGVYDDHIRSLAAKADWHACWNFVKSRQQATTENTNAE